jgi:hypothetical protein
MTERMTGGVFEPPIGGGTSILRKLAVLSEVVKCKQESAILKSADPSTSLVRMSFEQVIAELPRMTFEQRQALVRRAVEIDDSPLSQSDEALIEERLAAHKQNPDSSVPLESFKKQLRSRSKR